jgi:hypothetical protein
MTNIMLKQPSLVSVETVEKWLTLAQRRCAYFEGLQQSGRWRRIYSEESALQSEMHNAVRDAENWTKVLERALNAQPSDDAVALRQTT